MSIYTKEEQFELIKENPLNLENIDNQYEEVCLEAVKQDEDAFEYVEEQTERICIEAVKQNGWLLDLVENQTEKICLEAVKENGYALPYVRKQTEEICLEAVKQNGKVLEYVEEQTEKICLEAIKNSYKVIEKVKNKTPLLCFCAFLQDYSLLNLKYIENGLKKYIKNKNTVENAVFCTNSYKNNKKINNNYYYYDIRSLIYIKDFLIKENNNTYIFTGEISYIEESLDLFKELAFSNNKLVIVNTSNVQPIHRKLANKVITIEELENESF